jgi:hypothetical protein
VEEEDDLVIEEEFIRSATEPSSLQRPMIPLASQFQNNCRDFGADQYARPISDLGSSAGHLAGHGLFKRFTMWPPPPTSGIGIAGGRQQPSVSVQGAAELAAVMNKACGGQMQQMHSLPVWRPPAPLEVSVQAAELAAVVNKACGAQMHSLPVWRPPAPLEVNAPCTMGGNQVQTGEPGQMIRDSRGVLQGDFSPGHTPSSLGSGCGVPYDALPLRIGGQQHPPVNERRTTETAEAELGRAARGGIKARARAENAAGRGVGAGSLASMQEAVRSNALNVGDRMAAPKAAAAPPMAQAPKKASPAAVHVPPPTPPAVFCAEAASGGAAQHTYASGASDGASCDAASRKPPVTSIGSAKHPDNCVECSFFFFNGGSGCRAGANCTFCHEYHPRKNPRKNRRLLRVFKESKAGDQLQDEEDGGSQEEEGGAQASSGVSPTPDLAKKQASNARIQKVLDKARKSKAAIAEGPAAPKEITFAEPNPDRTPEVKEDGDAVRSETLSFSYSPSDKRVLPITLAVGMACQLKPHLFFCKPEVKAALENELTFVSEPPLPKGLHLEERTGCITGTPTAEGCTSHIVSAKTKAVCPSGIFLRELVLSSCTLLCTVVDFSQFTLCSSAQAGSGGRLTLVFDQKE